MGVVGYLMGVLGYLMGVPSYWASPWPGGGACQVALGANKVARGPHTGAPRTAPLYWSQAPLDHGPAPPSGLGISENAQ